MPTPKSPARRDILKLKVERPDGIYKLDGYQLRESIGYLLKRSALQLAAMLDQELAPYDLTHPQFSILMMLKELNCSTAADLAREMCGDTGAVTRMLDRLEAKDIIRRIRSVEDRRIVNIELTATGKMIVEKMPVLSINVMNRHLHDFTSDEVTSFKKLLRKLMKNIGEAGATNTATPTKTSTPAKTPTLAKAAAKIQATAKTRATAKSKEKKA